VAIIGLRDLYYAVLDTDSNSEATYEEIKPIAPAVEATITPELAEAIFYADDGPDEVITIFKEAIVGLQTKDIGLSTQAELLGHKFQGSVLIKHANDEPPYVAIGFRSLKSDGSYRYVWLMKGKFAPYNEQFKTKGEAIEFQTPTITGKFIGREHDDAWQALIDSNDDKFADNFEDDGDCTWFDKVYGATEEA